MTYKTDKCQKGVSDYYITLLSGEIIELPHLKSEDVNENRDDDITINLTTATNSDRLYEAFKNKELIQHIRRVCDSVDIKDTSISKQEFTYDHYFKISEFSSSIEFDSCGVYYVVFETI